MNMAGAAEGTFVGTAQVAAALKVGVSTVKRWVDDGVLPAHRTAGGHRKLLLADVLRFARESDFRPLDLTRLGGAAPTGAASAGKLFDALRVGDSDAVRLLLHGLRTGNMPMAEVADAVVAPAMHRIGREWEAGRLGVMHEHRAVQIVLAALLELRPDLERPGRKRPAAVGGSPEGDPYLMTGLLAQMTLMECGWRAINLGPNTPVEAFRRAISELRPRLLWISATWLPNPATLTAGLAALLGDAKNTGTAVIVGGQAVDDSLRAKAGYASFGSNLADLASFARALNPQKPRPKRGRPARA